MALLVALVAWLLVFAESQANDKADRSNLQGFLSKYLPFESDDSRTPLGHYDKFIIPKLNHMKHRNGPGALIERKSVAAYGPVADDSSTDKEEETAEQKLLANGGNNAPITLFAIGVGFLALVAMLRVRIRKALQPASVLASSGAPGSDISLTTAPALGDNIMEMNSQGLHINAATACGDDEVDRAARGAELASISGQAHGAAWRPCVEALVDSNNNTPITLSAIGDGFFALVTRLGARLQRGKSVSILASSGAAPVLGDSVTEMNPQGLHMNSAAACETRHAYKDTSRRVAWEQPSSQITHPLTLCHATPPGEEEDPLGKLEAIAAAWRDGSGGIGSDESMSKAPDLDDSIQDMNPQGLHRNSAAACETRHPYNFRRVAWEQLSSQSSHAHTLCHATPGWRYRTGRTHPSGRCYFKCKSGCEEEDPLGKLEVIAAAWCDSSGGLGSEVSMSMAPDLGDSIMEMNPQVLHSNSAAAFETRHPYKDTPRRVAWEQLSPQKSHTLTLCHATPPGEEEDPLGKLEAIAAAWRDGSGGLGSEVSMSKAPVLGDSIMEMNPQGLHSNAAAACETRQPCKDTTRRVAWEQLSPQKSHAQTFCHATSSGEEEDPLGKLEAIAAAWRDGSGGLGSEVSMSKAQVLGDSIMEMNPQGLHSNSAAAFETRHPCKDTSRRVAWEQLSPQKSHALTFCHATPSATPSREEEDPLGKLEAIAAAWRDGSGGIGSDESMSMAPDLGDSIMEMNPQGLHSNSAAAFETRHPHKDTSRGGPWWQLSTWEQLSSQSSHALTFCHATPSGEEEDPLGKLEAIAAAWRDSSGGLESEVSMSKAPVLGDSILDMNPQGLHRNSAAACETRHPYNSRRIAWEQLSPQKSHAQTFCHATPAGKDCSFSEPPVPVGSASDDGEDDDFPADSSLSSSRSSTVPRASDDSATSSGVLDKAAAAKARNMRIYQDSVDRKIDGKSSCAS